MKWPPDKDWQEWEHRAGMWVFWWILIGVLVVTRWMMLWQRGR